jgi:amino acid transporter
MDGGVLQQGVYVLENLGVVDVILPFILVFVIVFAVLQKTKILGENKEGKPMKNFNSVIALVMGLAVVIPHVMGSYPDPNMDIVNIINIALPNIVIADYRRVWRRGKYRRLITSQLGCNICDCCNSIHIWKRCQLVSITDVAGFPV